MNPPIALFVFVLAFLGPAMAWNCGDCKDVFDYFSPCSHFIIGQCEDPSPLCCLNVENLNAIAKQESDGPVRICKCIEYFAAYKAQNPFNASQIQDLPLKCDTHLSFPISEHMDCSRIV